MRFAWDQLKAVGNVRKHGVSFDEATTVFGDPFSFTAIDGEHSLGERRFLTLGVSSSQRLLVVSHTDDEDTVRIISARNATGKEQQIHEKG